MSYIAPVKDMLFCMKELADIESIAKLPGFEDAGFETAQAVLEESARFCQEVLAPLNREGDVNPSSWKDGVVTTTPGFKQAFRQFAEGGWQGLQHPVEFGGQGLPKTIGAACIEMINSANLSFSLCPLLTDGAIEALLVAGSAEQRERFIPKMISGEWTGTMNLTEPQAGSDLGAIRTRAEPAADGTYRLKGQKIFITYGEHDFTENIVHFVLARLPDAPAGSKGISLFIVPKFLPNPDGSLGQRNDLRVVSLEKKLGIHASPTCVMAYGDNEGAIAYRVGEPNRGLEYMFIMMNNARLAVGIQGLAISERAYQHAVAYARQRVQGAPVDGSKGAPILHHPDVRRNLLTMRALTEGMRALVLYCAGALDRAKRHPDKATRESNQALTDLLIPIVKAWCTDQGVRVASLGVQVHGGVGFIEETGAAQYFRDSRIAPIYEGTNGIQAMDLLGRKLLRDQGKTMQGLINEIKTSLDGVDDKAALTDALRQLEQATAALLKTGQSNLPAALAVATPYLGLCGTVIAGWLLARAAREARNQSGLAPDFVAAKQATAAFFSSNLLVEATSEAARVIGGGASTLAFPLDAF